VCSRKLHVEVPEPTSERTIQNVDRERALARAARSGDRAQDTERKLHVDAREIVLGRATHAQHRPRATRRPPNRLHPVECACRRTAGLRELLWWTIANDATAIRSRTRAELDHAIRSAN